MCNMVTLENNRTQSSVADPFDRPKSSESQAEAGAEDVRSEPYELITLRRSIWSVSDVVARATMASMFGLSAVALTILGLTGILAQTMLPVAGIVLAAAFAALATVDVAWGRMFGFLNRATSWERMMCLSGLAAAASAAIAAMVLCVLNLVFPADLRLSAVAIILLGGGLLWHSGIMRAVSRLSHEVSYRGHLLHRPGGPLGLNALSLAPVRDSVVGLVAMTLGVLAIFYVAPMILGFIAMLAVGAALTFSASTVCGASLATLEEVVS
jgi:hypothetical protein